jgi:polyisoprenoid-binding protein YceI
MKKLVLFLFALSCNLNAAIKYLPGTYQVDPDHTRVGFTIEHFVISLVQGRFNDVKGTFTLAPKFADSSADVVVQINSVDTAVQKRDEDLRSKNFFDAAVYPTMTMKTERFSGTPENFTLVADLTIKDVTKKVTFTGHYTGAMKDPWGNDRVALNLSGKINRKDFHIDYNQQVSNGPGVGDIVNISVLVEGIKKAQDAVKK